MLLCQVSMANRRQYRTMPALFLAAAALHAGDLDLKPATLMAWNEHERAALLAMQQCLHNDGPFLTVDHDTDRIARMRAGEILVWQAHETNPQQVPSGLIHDWIGAAFIPNARIVDVLSVVRDYRRYNEVYKPGVLDASGTWTWRPK